MRLRQSVCAPIFEPAAGSIDALCSFARRIGLDAIELWGWDDSIHEIAQTAARHGLALASITGHESIEHGLNDESQWDRALGELEASIRVAAELGIPGVIAFPGGRRPGQSDAEGMVATARALRRIAPLAERTGVNVNVEVLNSRVDHFDYQGDRVEWCLALCEMVGSPRVKILFDVYHVQVMQGDVIANLKKAMPQIGHIHVAGVPGRGGLDDRQELNYGAIGRAIAESGYEGYVGHEFFPQGGDPLVALEAAVHICRSQL